MTLKEFIEKTKAEEGITTDTDDIRKYLIDKAEKQKSGMVAVVDDDTVKEWILQCREGVPNKEQEKPKKTAEEMKAEAIEQANRERPTTKRTKEWEMESLF